MQTLSAAKTDVGQVRSINQDHFLCSPESHVYMVADGMGGHAGGEVASQLCTSTIFAILIESGKLESLAGEPNPSPRIMSELSDAVNQTSTKIYERALEQPDLKGMGTTSTLLYLRQGYAYYAHVGDSRLYLIRQGLIYQITNDHSLVSEQLRAGLITEEEAEVHHLRSVVTRSVGYQEEEEVDTGYIHLENDDFLLLCSDGLHGHIEDQELATIIHPPTGSSALNSDGSGPEEQARLERVVSQLIDTANERGGEDNITALVVKYESP